MQQVCRVSSLLEDLAWVEGLFDMKEIPGPYPPKGMDAYPVSERVNSPMSDDEY